MGRDFEKRFYDFIVALNIARVGAFEAGTALLFVNGQYERALKFMNFYSREVLGYSISKNLPKFESLSIRETWNWYLITAFPKGVDEISVGSLSRAINAFTYLFDKTLTEASTVFWIMVGIEALYIKGSEKVRQQLRYKLPLFLGEIKNYKVHFDSLYGYRSAFVHGGKNFPGFFHINDGLESFEYFIQESSEAIEFGTCMLLLTLQKMAKENLNKLDLEFRMFTLDQIKTAHSKVKSGADFPAYIRDLKQLGVVQYVTFVKDGHTDYAGKENFKTSSPSRYADLQIASSSNPVQFKTDLKSHQQGKTDYPTFCSDCAKSGIEKWIVDLDKMTCTYFDKTGNEVLVEQVPQ